MNAIVGLILLLLAYTILNTINPELVTQKGAINALGLKELKKGGKADEPATPASAPATQSPASGTGDTSSRADALRGVPQPAPLPE